MTKEELKYYSLLTDSQLLEEIYSGNKKAETYLFCEKCISVIHYHVRRTINKNQMQTDEAIHEFYLYMKDDDWHRLKQYEGRNNASVKTWISVVAFRFFLQLHKDINKTSMNKVDLSKIDSLNNIEYDEQYQKVKEALLNMPNVRYRNILIKMYYEGKTRKETADEMNVGINYFYVLHQRAENQFKEFYK
jgi:DNA-directed RNA polymerase specialized sigma subunit